MDIKQKERSRILIVETESKWIPLIHICMPAHFSDLVQVLQENVAGLNYYKGPKPPIIMT
jgi:hypothetical protein